MKTVKLNQGKITKANEKLVEKGLRILKEEGYKITQKRREILSIFAENQRYITALAIHNALKVKYPTMSYNTSYRNLYDFVKIGLLETTEYNQEQLFRLNCQLTDASLPDHKHDHDHHHHHFICTSCGRTIPLDACPMDHITTDLSDVVVENHRFEVFGLCQKCK